MLRMKWRPQLKFAHADNSIVTLIAAPLQSLPQVTLGARLQQLLPAFTPRDIAQTLAGYAGLGLGVDSKALGQVSMAYTAEQSGTSTV